MPGSPQAVRGPRVLGVGATPERVGSELTLPPLTLVLASLDDGLRLVMPESMSFAMLASVISAGR